MTRRLKSAAAGLCLRQRSFPCRDEDEVREKMKKLGLVAQTGKQGNVRVCVRAQRKAPRRGGARFEVAVRSSDIT